MYIAASALVLVAVAALTVVVWAAVRETRGATARHYANLGLPFGLAPVLLALAIAGPRDGIGSAVLIVAVLMVTGVAESHVTGRLATKPREHAEASPKDEADPGAREHGSSEQRSHR